MGYSAKVIADSLSPAGHRLTTIEVTLPRIVLAELNTHKLFSRNSASSRAIPVAKMIERVMVDPFIPIYWGRNQSGMQAAEEVVGDARENAISAWLTARDHAVQSVKDLQLLNIHKQIANRLLEPWLWHTVIVTATHWDNFFALRCHPAAQPEMRRAAEIMRDAMEASTPHQLDYGDWHMPYVDLAEIGKTSLLRGNTGPLLDWCLVSAGRCARVSYLTHDGVRDPAKDIELAYGLRKNGHMSPFEHVATPMTLIAAEAYNWSGNFYGWKQYRKTIASEDDFSKVGAK